MRSRRSARLAPVLSLALVVGLAGCGSRVSTPKVSPTPSGPPAANPSAAAGNTASDRGVSTREVRVGIIVGKSSPLGPDTFSASLYGAQAFFDALNARGGVHGRTVRTVVCDDGGSGTGNVKCVHQLIDRDRVFALAGVTAFQYDGADYVNKQDVPDVGGQPVGNAYDQYPHLYSIYGNTSPRDGKTVGYNGTLYGGTEVYRWFKVNRGTKKAGVVAYNVAPSQRYASYLARGLRAEGYDVTEEQVALGLPNYDAAVLDMKSRGVDSVYDALDDAGNVRLCKAMDAHGLRVTAKVTTPQSWSDSVRSLYRQSPTCRNSIYATSNTRNYEDRQYAPVGQFRDAAAALFPDRESKLSMWELEGWASAQWLTDAMDTCGATLTRACVEAFLNRPQDYDGHGLLTPRNFVPEIPPKPTAHNCLNVAQWQDSANGGRGGWVTRVTDMDTTCFDVPDLPYPAD